MSGKNHLKNYYMMGNRVKNNKMEMIKSVF